MDYTSVDELRREFLPQLSTSEDPVLGKIITWSSRAIDRRCNRRFFTTTGDEVRTFDGPRYEAGGWRDTPYPWPTFGSRVWGCAADIASLTTLEVAADSRAASSGTYTTIQAGDFQLQPADRTDGTPAMWIELAETASASYNSSTPFQYFQPGLRTVRLTGRFGWNSTTVDSTNFPQEIRLVAIEMAVKAWRTRESGYSNTVGVSEIGVAAIERQLSPFAREIIDAYTRPARP